MTTGDADLFAQLQSALGSSYEISRELGGGGMSRVFLATDVALQRDVVIKVLHPELAAGVNAERFKREVLLSARLQHPHIVPVLTAGEIAGLPYYVMPFVKGDTLRTRIDAGPLTISEVVDITGDVAKALAYAHGEGVVHRDIKPDNILLSGGAATVADFGIAKALSSARVQADDGALTTLGTSLGTPAYMAPEQVAGDPDTDHRADIYSLGGVMYEMLCGKAPFAGKSPQQMLAAQVMEQPVNITSRRADTPPSLARLVMRCLAKEPSERPQTAMEIASPLEAAQAPSASHRGLWIAAATVVALIAGAFGYTRVHRHAAPTGTINLAVAPFEVLDPQLALWKEGIVDVLSRNLDGAGPLRSISPSVAIKRWDGRAERTAALDFGRKVGAQIVLYGQLQSAGQGLVSAKLWIVDRDSPSASAEIDVRDSVTRMDRVADSLSFRALAAIGRVRTIGAAKLASLGSNSLPAVRAFLQGAQYFRRTQWDSAARVLREAVTIDSTFGIAYAMLGETYGWTGESGNTLQWDAFTRAGQLARPGLSPHDSLTLVAVRHFARTHDKTANRFDELAAAYAAANAVASQYPDDAAAWYLYGDMRFHNDKSITEQQALNNFDHAISADSDFAPAYIHAIELAYRFGPEVGRRYASAYVRHSADGLQKNGVRLAMMLADKPPGSETLKSILDTINPTVAGNAFSSLRRLPDSAEVMTQVLRVATKRFPMGDNAKALADVLGFRGHVSEAWKMSLDKSSYSAAEIAWLGLVPADSAVRAMLPWIKRANDESLYALPALGAAHDTANLNLYAASAERRMQADTSARRRAILAYFSHAARAYSALARGDTANATRLFDAFSDSSISLPVDQFVRARLVARTEPARALVLLERMTSASDVMYVARQLERGRVAERLGDAARAVEAYAYVASAWQNTDAPLLRTAVQESRTALARLDADGRMRATLIKQR